MGLLPCPLPASLATIAKGAHFSVPHGAKETREADLARWTVRCSPKRVSIKRFQLFHWRLGRVSAAAPGAIGIGFGRGRGKQSDYSADFDTGDRNWVAVAAASSFDAS
ncbi:hypothetical protein QR680_013556 [Steinernema hermaphroditum]|uniref:Uncharacterized protein n=1 Tax=Steinernema hermaphroditum TaxID=289476 RepID=A0AA39I7B5_9BILA|nr:hypothetical protein QR680_013556 [Steinernema hermaphroditum]